MRPTSFRKIDQHQCSAAPWVRQQIARIGFIFLRRAALPRAGDRTNLDKIISQADMHFWRAAHQEYLESRQTCRRMIDKTQRAVKIQRITSKLRLESLRRNHLKNIAGVNMASRLTIA